MPFTLIHANVFDGLRRLKDGSIHTIVTSPPYWPLRDYDCGDGEIGSESTPEQYIDRLSRVFRDCSRVLHSSGTLWLNMGDTWATPRNHKMLPENERPDNTGLVAGFRSGRHLKRPLAPAKIFGSTVKAKDMTCIPWRVAMQLQADGWYLRSTIIVYKRNAMPGSYDDRPSHAYDYVFLFSKREHYFYDKLAVTTEQVLTPGSKKPLRDVWVLPTDDVWDIPIKGYKGAHFATFPEALPDRCIRLGTSGYGCCRFCNEPFVQIVETNRTTSRPANESKSDGLPLQVRGHRDLERHTTDWIIRGWRPNCICGNKMLPVPCTVLDPFVGSGTTCLVAEKLGRTSIGIDLNRNYLVDAHKRITENRPCPRNTRCPGC